MSELIRSKIAAARSRHSLVQAATGVSMSVGSLVGLVFLGALADWLFDLPWLLRAVLLAGYLAYAAYLLWKYAIEPVVRAPDDEEIALRVEHAEPTFSSRLISTVQFSSAGAIPAGASIAMARVMMRETEEMAARVDFTRIVQMQRLGQFAGAAFIVLVLAGALFAAGGSTSRDLVARAFLSNTALPTKTRVTSLTGSFTAARGDDAILKAKAEGWRPRLGKAEIQYASGQKQTVVLEQSSEDSSLYTGTLASVQESFTYTLRVYDGRTQEPDQVKVSIRPTVVQIDCSVVYPKYTGLGTVKKPASDLSVLAGSRLQLKVVANKNVRVRGGVSDETNYVQLFSSEKSAGAARQPLTVNPANRSELTADLALPATAVGFTIHLVDDDGLASKDAAVYRIDPVADHPPLVRIVVPDRKEVLVTRDFQLQLDYTAEDDFGLAGVTLRYRVDEGDEQAQPLPLEDKGKSLHGRYLWSIAGVKMPADKPTPEGSVIEFWLEATDLNDVDGPLKGSTEHYQARIVSRDDKQKELIGRMGQQLTIMRSITAQQDETSKDLGSAIERTTGAPTPGTPPATR